MSDPRQLPASAPSGPVLAHCDVLRAAHQVAPTTNRRELLDRHLTRLREIADGRAVWFPTFNYDYCRTGVYDVERDPSQVGRLNESARLGANWRSSTPVFNVCSLDLPVWDAQADEAVVDPFGPTSVFAALAAADGVIVWYGAGVESTTALHHCESRAGGVPYRYSKLFDGVVRTQSDERSVTLDYSVRPMGHTQEYDWSLLTDALDAPGIRRPLDDRHQVWWASARDLVETWSGIIRRAPTRVLDEATRRWVDDELSRLGRPFELKDFEP